MSKAEAITLALRYRNAGGLALVISAADLDVARAAEGGLNVPVRGYLYGAKDRCYNGARVGVLVFEEGE